MVQAAQGLAKPKYRAFVSYSHADARIASWLHRRLEALRLPDGERLTPIFIDRAELVAGPDLSAQVRTALAESAMLLVIASPSAKASRWVAQEIALFRELNPDRPILAALIEGEPEAAFPTLLTSHAGQEIEPLAADFRKGQDGRRLGLLKIAAGLSGQPLDRLVQRDAQARQRRVMAVTAGAVLLSLVLAALLVAALRARNEARHQRAEAEGLVEFMLTDLRDRLKGVGRLDVMDAVNQRAMVHYAGATTLQSSGDDELRRRAKLFLAMAEDDLSSTARQNEGRDEARLAGQVSDTLLRREPDDSRNLFLKGQSEFWIGYSSYRKGDRAQAGLHWNAYHALATRLVAKDPRGKEARSELGYAESNLCALALIKPPRPADALKHCDSAKKIAGALAAESADDLQRQLDYLNRLGWLSDANMANGKRDAAVALRHEQVEFAEALMARQPKDYRVHEALLRSELGLAATLKEAGQAAHSTAAARRALTIADELHRHDPANKDWTSWREEARKFSQ
ncbi:MAG: toll/interleukin-1 receptor domain-containing protein [Novosphingobium sp.]